MEKWKKRIIFKMTIIFGDSSLGLELASGYNILVFHNDYAPTFDITRDIPTSIFFFLKKIS